MTDKLKKEEPVKVITSAGAKSENELQREKILERANEIKKEFGGLESDIPVPHEYWHLMNQYRALLIEFQEGKA